jgi:hypothetical protein
VIDDDARSTPLTCTNGRPRRVARTTRLTYWRALPLSCLWTAHTETYPAAEAIACHTVWPISAISRWRHRRHVPYDLDGIERALGLR